MRLLAAVGICSLIISCNAELQPASSAKDAVGELNLISNNTGSLSQEESEGEETPESLNGPSNNPTPLPPEVPCDFNFSGKVDGADLTIWKNNYGIESGASSSQGDCDSDGDVDGRDFLSWQRNFGKSIYDFEIIPPPNPTLTSTPVIQWTESYGAFGYNMHIATDAGCTNFIENHAFLGGLSQQVGPLANGTYYICVYADNPSAGGAPLVGGDDVGPANFTETFLAAKNNGLPLVIDAPVLYQHRIFITSGTFSVSAGAEPNPGFSDFGGLQSADLQCSRKAAAAGYLPGWNNTDRIYKALISTNSVNAIDRLVIEGRIINTQNQVVAADSNQFWFGTLSNPVTYNEFGSALAASTPFWTGSNATGVVSQNCLNWSQTTSQFANVGYSSATSFWFNQAQLACSQAKRLVCIGPAEIQ